MSFTAELQALVKATRISGPEPPTTPISPTEKAHKRQIVGTLGTVGRGQASKPHPCTPSPEDLEDAFEERSAILEFDAHFSRREAERRAREEKRSPIGEWPHD